METRKGIEKRRKETKKDGITAVLWELYVTWRRVNAEQCERHDWGWTKFGGKMFVEVFNGFVGMCEIGGGRYIPSSMRVLLRLDRGPIVQVVTLVALVVHVEWGHSSPRAERRRHSAIDGKRAFWESEANEGV